MAHLTAEYQLLIKTLRTGKADGCWDSSKTVETACDEPVM